MTIRYLAHWGMDRYLGHETAEALIQEAAVESARFLRDLGSFS